MNCEDLGHNDIKEPWERVCDWLLLEWLTIASKLACCSAVCQCVCVVVIVIRFDG